MFRVYDKINKKWIEDNVYLNPKGELFLIKQSVFGWIKMPLELSQDRYVYHKAIDLYDKDGVLIYEGDRVKAQVAEDKIVTGIVIYAQEFAGYIIWCFGLNEYYMLSNDVCEYIEVIGNVFDGCEEGEQYGQQTLQEDEV